MMIRMYSTHCPKCKVLEMKLKSKGIEYEECTDTEEMRRKGIRSAPTLEVDGNMLEFGEAVRWVNGR